MLIFEVPQMKHVKALQSFRDAFCGATLYGDCGLQETDSIDRWVKTRAWAKRGSICYILYDEYNEIVLAIARLNTVLTEELIRTGGYNFGYCTHPNFRRCGYGLMIMSYCMLIAKVKWNLKEFKMEASKDNISSWKCMEKAGAVRIGETNDQYIYCKRL